MTATKVAGGIESPTPHEPPSVLVVFLCIAIRMEPHENGGPRRAAGQGRTGSGGGCNNWTCSAAVSRIENVSRMAHSKSVVGYG